MVKYGIIFKKSSAKIWQGSQVAKKSVSKSQLESFVRKNKRKGFVIKVVTEGQIMALKKQLKTLVVKLRKRSKLRKVTRGKVVRKRRKR